MKKTSAQSRRDFLTNAALGTAGILGASSFLSSCSGNGTRNVELDIPPAMPLQAPEGEEIRAGVIGCGGRGTGAVINFLKAGPGLKLVAMADIFEDKMASSREKIKKEMDVEVPDANCYIGFDAYKKVIESDVNYLIIATPPYFRPLHFEAAVEARKHVFMEKPLAVDPVGVRSIISSSKRAESIGLNVVTGTQRHHQDDYIQTYQQVMKGAIGDIVAANCYWNQGQLWYKNRKAEWTDMEWMLRDWVNWAWLSGDHIVEQHIHNIDVINWFLGGKFPQKAVATGSRHRRVTGDQYDNFSVDFVYEGDVHVHSMCRQIDGCTKNVSEFIRGTKGYSNCRNYIHDMEGNEIWKYQKPEKEEYPGQNGYDQEHVNLITSIRTGKYINNAEFTAKSVLAAIMGRIAAYTGGEVTWDDMMKSGLQLGPESVTSFGSSDLINNPVPVPGEADNG